MASIEDKLSKKYNINFEITDEIISEFKNVFCEEKKRIFKITPRKTIKSIEQLKHIVLNSYDIKDKTLFVGFYFSFHDIIGLRAIGETKSGEWIKVTLDLNKTYYFHYDTKTFEYFKPYYGDSFIFEHLKKTYDGKINYYDYMRIYRYLKRIINDN